MIYGFFLIFYSEKFGIGNTITDSLVTELSGFVDKPYFHGTLLRVLEVVESVPDDFVSKFSKAVKLSLAQEITLALSLATSVEPKIQQEGTLTSSRSQEVVFFFFHLQQIHISLI
jgi:hypothetical protein